MKLLRAIVIASLFALPAVSSATDMNQMPMTGNPYGPQPMMDPAMMQRMMQMRQQQMSMQRNQTGMPMMANPAEVPAIEEGKKQSCHHGMKHRMGAEKGNMPMMEMMQGKQAMMQAHMVKMEVHLANIEALLQQLVNAQSR